jgi:hypothetical protein
VETADASAALGALGERVEGSAAEGVAAMAELVKVAARSAADAPIARRAAESIEFEPPVPSGPGVFTAKGGPTVVFGRRAEIGFHGVDSIGRNYSSPGAPGHRFFVRGVEAVAAGKGLEEFVRRVAAAIEG